MASGVLRSGKTTYWCAPVVIRISQSPSIEHSGLAIWGLAIFPPKGDVLAFVEWNDILPQFSSDFPKMDDNLN